MENIYLSSDESIVLTNQNIIVDGIRYEAVLTSRRLVLIRSDDVKAPPQEILLTAIGTAVAGENALREPTITLSLTSPDGVIKTTQLVFIRLVSENKNHQFDEWLKRLKEHVSITVQEPVRNGPHPLYDDGTVKPIIPQGIPGTENQQVEMRMPQIPSYVFRPPKPVTLSQESNITKIVVIIIVISVVLIAAFIGYQSLKTKPPSGSGTASPAATGTKVPATIATVASPTLSSQLPAQPVSAVITPQVWIPPSGVWVKIQYPGNFTGSVGTRGRMREVNSTGDQYYQIPTLEGIIEADIKKMDGSGDPLAIEIYNNGKLIKRVNSTKPGATLYINAEL